MTVSLGGTAGIEWGAPDFENDGSSMTGLTPDVGPVTFESLGSYIVGSTANILQPRGVFTLPLLEGAFAKCVVFEVYAPSAQSFVQFQPSMGVDFGMEIVVGAPWLTSPPYNRAYDQCVLATGASLFSFQPLPTPFTFDAWHTIRHISLANGSTALWLDDDLVMSMATFSQEGLQTITQLKVPPTAQKATHSLRFRNIRSWSAKSGAPNIS